MTSKARIDNPKFFLKFIYLINYDCVTVRLKIPIQLFCVTNQFPINWMCKKPTSVSHRSTESEIIPLDVRLRKDGVVAIDVWDLIVTILDEKCVSERETWPAQNFHQENSREALLYVLEDNEAVIKIIIKEISPTMSHVSGNQRVALWLVDWWIEIINTDSKIKLADIYWKNREISHVMNEIIFCVCSTSVISVPLIDSNRCRKEHKKIQMPRVTVKSKPMMNWSLDTVWGIRTCLPRLHLKVLWKPNLKVRTYPQIWQVCHRWWYGLWHRRRIEPFSQITLILEQSEWSIAKDVGPFDWRFQTRHWQFYDLVNCYVFDIGRILIRGEESLGKIIIPSENWPRIGNFKLLLAWQVRSLDPKLCL